MIGDLWDWFTDSSNWQGDSGIPHLLGNHLQVSFAAILAGALIALPVGLALGHARKGGIVAVNVANVGRALPTFAILVFAVQAIGISNPRGLAWTGSAATWVALVLLAVPPMLTNSYVGMTQVDPELVDAARGMGMEGRHVLWRVELPLALPLVMAGLRTAGLNVVATATLASFTGFATLGEPIIVGIRVGDDTRVLAGALLVALVSVAVELGLAGAQRLVVSPGLTRREVPSVAERAQALPEAA